MTNFELITKDEFFLANWLSNVRMNCNICPVRRECTECEDTVDKLCFRVLYDWLKREA